MTATFPSLQNLSLSSVVSLLKPLGYKPLLRHFAYCNTSTASSVYNYILRAAPFLVDIAHMCQYYKSATLTDVFFPILIKKGLLQISSDNVDNIIKRFGEEQEFLNISSLTHLKVTYIDVGSSLHILYFLRRLSNLTFLDAGCSVDDDMLAVLGINCPHLEVLDVREGIVNSVTNTGLSYLSFCKKLRRVLFSMFPDQYSCRLDKISFSGDGVAFLLLALPKLEQFMCSEYLLRDALNYMCKIICQERTLSVKCLFLDHPEVAVDRLFANILPLLCPEIEVLTLCVTPGKEGIVGQCVTSLTKLKILVLSIAAEYSCIKYEFSAYGFRLVYLQIVAQLIGSKDILLLSKLCPNLKTLGLKMASFGFESLIDYNSGVSLFPSVERLELQQNISVRLFKLLNICMKNLKELYCAGAMIRDLEKAIHVIVDRGGWKKTTILVLPVLEEVSLTMAKRLANILPNIECLSLSLSQIEEDEMKLYLMQSKQTVSLIHQDLISPPSNSGVFASSLWTDELKKNKKVS